MKQHTFIIWHTFSVLHLLSELDWLHSCRKYFWRAFAVLYIRLACCTLVVLHCAKSKLTSQLIANNWRFCPLPCMLLLPTSVCDENVVSFSHPCMFSARWVETCKQDSAKIWQYHHHFHHNHNHHHKINYQHDGVEHTNAKPEDSAQLGKCGGGGWEEEVEKKAQNPHQFILYTHSYPHVQGGGGGWGSTCTPSCTWPPSPPWAWSSSTWYSTSYCQKSQPVLNLSEIDILDKKAYKYSTSMDISFSHHW